MAPEQVNSEAGFGGSPVRVLVADDDPLARVVLRRTLNDGGITVIAEAGSAAEAIELAAKRLPDVAVMDAALYERADGSGFPRPFDTRVLVLANVLNPVGRRRLSGRRERRERPLAV